MIRSLLLSLALLAPCGWLSAQGSQEVTLTARASSRLMVGVPVPQVAGLAAQDVETQFNAPLKTSLEDSGVFSVGRGTQPTATDAASYKAWHAAGNDWLLILKVSGTGDEVRVEATAVDVGPGKAVFQRTYKGSAKALRRVAYTLSDDLVFTLTRERGVAASQIVFVKEHGKGLKEIWQMDRDGSNARQLTHHRSLTISPSVAQDGRIAYVTYKGGSPEIWGQRVPGGPHVKLAPMGSFTGHCYAPAWSPDGTRLAYSQVISSRTGETDLMVQDIASGKVRRLTYNGCSTTSATWNPSGTQIAFESDRDGTLQIFLMEADGSNMRRLTREGSYNSSPSWSPSGAQIAYVSRLEGKFDLMVYKLGEGRAWQITMGVASSENPSWSPDERHLVFSSGSAAGKMLYVTDLSGNNVKRLGEMSGCEMPEWIRAK